MDSVGELEIATHCSSGAEVAGFRVRNLVHGAEPLPTQLDACLLLAMVCAVGNLDRLRVFEIRVRERTVGWFIGVREVTDTALRIGPLSLYRYGQLRLRFFGDYGFTPTSEPVDPSILTEAVLRILKNAEDDCAIFFQAVTPESPLSAVTASLRAKSSVYVRPDYADRVRHRLAAKGDFDTYLKTRSTNTRQTYRHILKKLRDHCAGDVALDVYDTPESMSEFARVASQIALKSHRIEDPDAEAAEDKDFRERLRIAADLGAVKGFVLRCQGLPVAYIEGYQAGGVFFAYQSGFVVEWSKWSVGTACQLEALKYLMNVAPDRPQTVDYFEGDVDFKRRLCNVRTTEASIWIMRRTYRSWILITLQALLDVISWVLRRPAKLARTWLSGQRGAHGRG